MHHSLVSLPKPPMDLINYSKGISSTFSRNQTEEDLDIYMLSILTMAEEGYDMDNDVFIQRTEEIYTFTRESGLTDRYLLFTQKDIPGLGVSSFSITRSVFNQLADRLDNGTTPKDNLDLIDKYSMKLIFFSFVRNIVRPREYIADNAMYGGDFTRILEKIPEQLDDLRSVYGDPTWEKDVDSEDEYDGTETYVPYDNRDDLSDDEDLSSE